MEPRRTGSPNCTAAGSAPPSAKSRRPSPSRTPRCSTLSLTRRGPSRWPGFPDTGSVGMQRGRVLAVALQIFRHGPLAQKVVEAGIGPHHIVVGDLELIRGIS